MPREGLEKVWDFEGRSGAFGCGFWGGFLGGRCGDNETAFGGEILF